MADQTRRVPEDGIHFGGEIFIAPELARVGGRTVQLRYTPHDLRAIEIFTGDGWLCTAHPHRTSCRASKPRPSSPSATRPPAAGRSRV